MKRTVFALCLLTFAAPSFAADFGKANVCADPAVLENAYLKISVDRKGGASARSVIDKADGRELAKEYLTSRGWNGALARDRNVEEGSFPGAVQFLEYRGEVVKSNGVQILSLTCATNHWRIGKWTFVKTYTLEDNAKRFKVDYTITNDNDEDRIFTPWIHNIVNPDIHETVYAAKDGIMWANTAHDFFHYPERNWLCDIERKSGKAILFAAEWNELLSQYWCWWNDCHCTEWVYVPKSLKKGESRTLTYWIGVTAAPDAPAVVTPDGAATWVFADGMMKITFSPTRFGKLKVTPVLNGNRKLDPVVADAKADKPVVIALDAAKLPKSGLMELEIEGALKYFKDLGNKLQFDFNAMLGVTTTAQRAWQRAPAAYTSVGSTDVPAKKFLDNIYETSPLRKVFKDDRMADGNLDRGRRLIRGGRYNWQFTVVNTNKTREAKYKIGPGCLTDGAGACIPLKITEIKWIRIDLPTMFSSKYKIGDYPDPIVPLRNDNFTVAKGENASFLVECDVPYDVPAGKYKGKVAVRFNGEVKHLELAAKVTGVTLPRQSYMKSTAGLRAPSKRLMQEVGYSGTQQEFLEAIREAYMRNRVCPRETDISWGAPAEQLAAQIQDYLDKGATTFWIPDGFFTKPGPQLEKIVKVLREKNAMSRAFHYISDEPSHDMFPAMVEKAKKLHEMYPDLRILSTCYGDGMKPLFGTIDIWCRGEHTDPWRAERVAKGDEFMTANLGNCNIEDQLAGLVRTFPVMKANMCSGFLYWNMINGYGDDNPWVRVAVSGSNGGHGHIMFPYTTGPVETVRWKAIGYGIELFDMISMLDKRAAEGKRGAEKARDAVYKRITDYKGDLQDEEQIESFRAQLIDALE